MENEIYDKSAKQLDEFIQNYIYSIKIKIYKGFTYFLKFNNIINYFETGLGRCC